MLARAPVAVELGKPVTLALTAKGEGLSLSIDGREVVTATDGAYRYGQAGLRMASAGRMSVERLEVVEL